MDELYPRQFGGVPEKFKAEGIKGGDNILIKIDDSVIALRDMRGKICKGQIYKITDIFIEPRGNARGFSKEIELEGFPAEGFNPYRFKLSTLI